MPETTALLDQMSSTIIHYEATTSYKLIYVFWVDDEAHRNLLKVGDASIDTVLLPDQLPPGCTELNKAAKDRIKQYSGTLGIVPQLLHTEIAVRQRKDDDGKVYLDSFRDYDVHRVLQNSGIQKVHPNDTTANEWFETDIATVKNAIKAVKEGRKALEGREITDVSQITINLREEQEDAVRKTIEVFKHGDQMLWNAKMRYGKTVTALTLVQRQLSKYKKTLIITHRPVVQSGWRDDFNLIFKNGECVFAKKETELEDEVPENITKIDYANEQQLKKLEQDGKPFIYFASIQDLRGSKRVGGKFNKNNAVFNMEWDLIINDEAHEGTQTELGQNVAAAIKKKHTKLLSLSGTPFNIMYQFDEDSVYTWDYVMEQARKEEWDKIHPGDPNPYAGLPQMHIFTYDLGDIIRGYSPELEGKAFNFSEFFRTWTGDPLRDGQDVTSSSVGEFVHKADVEKFLRLISTESNNSDYPFSKQEYRNMFRHTLWMVPGVKEAKALSRMLHDHPIFCQFGIANVAGEGDDYEETHAADALDLVKKTIRNNDYSITLSCGKLTTGVTIREWTACFMLSGSYMTGAANYLQTIFRVQSPGSVNGKTKDHCYVFDFAPDRTLRVVAEAAKVSRKGGSGGTRAEDERREKMRQFLNFCPVVAISGTTMKSYSVDRMMQQIKHIYAERAINSGFEDSSIYNDALLTLDKIDIQEFEQLKKIIGSTKANKSTGDVPVNEQGFTEEEYEKIQKLKKKKKHELTLEEKALLEQKKKQQEEKNKAISILRGVSIRMPLLIFGAEVPITEDITIEKFVDLVDDESWKEFMPDKVTKELFSKFTKYYDADVFIAAAKEIRLKAKRADGLLPTDRVQQIALIHSKFKNPDKETVLTPWRVVNMHMSDCLGGYCFYDETFAEDKKLEIPRFVDRGKVTADTLANPKAQILEINSKTGLYPLYVAYSIYRAKCAEFEKKHVGELTDKKQMELWTSVITDNLFVICKTPMAKAITQRTLMGYSETKVNAHCFDDLINQFKNKPEQFIKKVTKESYWHKGNMTMKFNAIVGNPPYQIMDGGNKNSSMPVYQHFVTQAKNLNPDYVSMIMPSRWFIGGKGLDQFRESMLKDKHIEMITDYADYRDVFPTVDLAGGICYFLWNTSYSGLCTVRNVNKNISNEEKRDIGEFEILIRDNKSIPIVRKVLEATKDLNSLSLRISARKPFGMSTDYKPHNSGIPCWFIQKYGKKYADPKDVKDTNDYLNKWKLLIPIAPIAGQTDFTKPVGFYYDGNIIIAKPGECCTESYVVCGAFDSENEVSSFKSYILTKTVRFLLLQSVISQHVTQKEFRFVPDLGTYCGQYTDDALCKQWGINEDEWQYINSRIHNYEGQSSKEIIEDEAEEE